MSDNAAFKELDAAFDSIIDEIENPDKPHEEVMIFRNLHGEKTEYADYAKVVHTVVVRVSDDGMTAAINVVSTAEKRRRYTIADLNRAMLFLQGERLPKTAKTVKLFIIYSLPTINVRCL